MEVDIPGELKKFSDVSPGTFFQVIASKEFGFCIELSGQRAAIMFSQGGRHRLQTGGLPRDVICYPHAVLRAEGFEFLSEGEYGSGSIMKAEAGSFIRVVDGSLDNFRTIDLVSGKVVPLGEDAPFVLYSAWKVGIVRDAELFPIFEWPGKKS